MVLTIHISKHWTFKQVQNTFAEKLKKLIKKYNLSGVPRKDYPVSVMMGLFNALSAQTLPDSLAKSFVMQSSMPQHWWEIGQTFSRSCATTSMIGHFKHLLSERLRLSA